jgi:hypothetical protein
MQKLKSYISVFFLALLLFPAAQKVMHEAGHLTDEHCDIKETHFCQYEHTCSICDYVFSSFAGAPERHSEYTPSVTCQDDFAFVKPSDKKAGSLAYTFSLRGPPTVS